MPENYNMMSPVDRAFDVNSYKVAEILIENFLSDEKQAIFKDSMMRLVPEILDNLTTITPNLLNFFETPKV